MLYFMLPSFTDTSALDWLNLSIPHLNVRSAFNAKKASNHIRKDAIESFFTLCNKLATYRV